MALRDEGVVDLTLLAPGGNGFLNGEISETERVSSDALDWSKLFRLVLLEGGALKDEVHAASWRTMSFTAAARSGQVASFASTRSFSGPASRACLPFFWMKARTLAASTGGFLMN